MFRSLLRVTNKNSFHPLKTQRKNFLSNAYHCNEAWNSRMNSPILQKVNLNDFYNELDQNYSSKGVISSIDVDIYANSVQDSFYLDELRDLLFKLRMSAETGNTLESTHHAAIRNFIEYGNAKDLVEMLADPLNYGIFLDDFTANILLDKLLVDKDYQHAAAVASLVMLQEDYSNDITVSLSLYSCYKFLESCDIKSLTEVSQATESKEKAEEIKIRIKFLRNPYYDDHFDVKDPLQLAGKTLVWMSEGKSGSISQNLQVVGWLFYKKYDKFKEAVDALTKTKDSKLFKQTSELVTKALEAENLDEATRNIVEECVAELNKLPVADVSIENSLKNLIEDAINRTQIKDIQKQEKLFNLWQDVREEKLVEQTIRLDKVKRLKLIEEKQKALEVEEQKLWFFDNEEKLDLVIENKEVEKESVGKTALGTTDEEYIPPEILPKRK